MRRCCWPADRLPPVLRGVAPHVAQQVRQLVAFVLERGQERIGFFLFLSRLMGALEELVDVLEMGFVSDDLLLDQMI
jgi:hypothetical protein